MSRDYLFRGNNAAKVSYGQIRIKSESGEERGGEGREERRGVMMVSQTLSMWSNVRRGEHTWIFPHQNEADFIFNSAMHCELPILKVSRIFLSPR